MMELRKAIVVKKPRQKIVLLMSFLLVLTALPTSIISAIATPDDLLSAIDLADDPAVTEDEPADGFSDSEGFPIDDNSIDDLSANPGQSDDTSSVEDGLSGLIPSGLLPIVDNDSPSLPALVDDSLPGIQPQANLEWKDGNPPTVADGDYIAISGSPSGTLVVPAGFQVVITGSVTNASQGLKLNIASGATVFWRADLIGSAANADGYLITIDGPGSFDAKECQITNSGQGGALSILGARQKVLLNDNALISSEANGNPVFIAADGVILIMYPHSSVISSTDTAFAAIQIDDGLSDVIIEINDSLVKADKKGNAISDGTGAGLPNNQTQIGLNDSAVVSSNDTAIYSNGVGSTIEVNYSTVSSPNSTSTLPVIHTVNLESGSVTIDHSKVSTVSTNSQGHAIQSTGSVILRHSEVSSVNGTAIKQVGNDKVITNLNSTVEATGSGTAVSIVPADPHSDDSYYFMYSGFTLAKTGNAIHFSGDYPKVSVSGGLVFAYGTEVWGENNVIFFENNLGSSSANEIGGLAIAWSGTSGAEYNSGSSTDLSYIPASAYCVCWRNFNGVGCIDYSEGGTNGYYPLDVTVLDDVDHGLIFDSFSGKMYLDMNDNQKLDLGVDTEFTAGQGTTWQAEPNKLTLDGFNWQTSKPWALLILGNNTEIVISGNNSFISTFYGHSLSYGIYASYPYHELSITGSGTLAATSGSTPGAQSSTVMAGIACHKLSITDATVIATGGSVPDNAYSDGLIVSLGPLIMSNGVLQASGYTTAIAWNVDATNSVLPESYKWWVNYDSPDNPGGAGTIYPSGSPIDLGAVAGTAKFVRIETYVDAVESHDGLIFDASSDPVTGGKFFVDINGNGLVDSSDIEYIPAAGTAVWDSNMNVLTLSNFHYSTAEPIALTIIRGGLTINLTAGSSSSIISTYNGTLDTAGILTDEISILNITGFGQLTVRGGSTTGMNSYGIKMKGSAGYSQVLTVTGSSLIAEAGDSAETSIGISATDLKVMNQSNIQAFGRASSTSAGVSVTNLLIDGGSLTTEGGETNLVSMGIFATGQLTYNSGVIVTAGYTNAIKFYDTTGSFSNNANAYTWWANSVNSEHPGGSGTVYPGGTAYAYTANHKYLMIESAEVDDHDYGLIFNADSSSASYGKFFLDIDNSGTINSGDIEYLPEAGTTEWNSTYANLTLTNFNWTTTAPVALTIVGDNLTINLPVGTTSSFISTFDGASGTAGIYAKGLSLLVFNGQGALTATGGDTTNGDSIGIVLVNSVDLDPRITIIGSSITAVGGSSNETSAGIVSPGLGLFGGQTITATGGSAPVSAGVVCNYTGIATGSLVASGDVSANQSYGLMCYNSFTYIGGSLVAIGSTGSITLVANPNGFINQAPAYTWWVNNTTTNPSGTGTLYPESAAYVLSANHKYVRLESRDVDFVYGLIFDADSTSATYGKFFLDKDYDGTISAADSEYIPPAGTAVWNSAGNTLNLVNFEWITSAPFALTIIGDVLSIYMPADTASSLISTNDWGSSTAGILIDGMNGVTFGGSGQLTAVGGDSPGGDSFGIAIVNSAAADPRITIIGSTIIATGGNNTAVSAGIVCPGLGLYGSCDVTATGGNATTSSGVVCSNIGLVEGSLSASADPAASDSVGIRCSYQLSFAAGTLEAKGATSAISLPTDITSFINAALAYSWLTNSTPVNPGGVGTLYPESAAYVHSNNSKYVKLESRDSDFVYGLIFDADSSSTTYGKFFLDTDFSGTLSYHDVEYIPEAGTTEWNSTYATLTLTNFNWSTTTPVALTIVGDNLTINLPDGTASSFISTYDGASDTAGILADDLSYLFLSGTGSLTATGGDSTDGNSFGIVLVNNTRLDQRITVLGSTITATGGKASEVSAGISSPSLGLFGMHTVTATGGNAPTSIGLSCLDLGISSGNLTAYGDLSADESYGIKCGQLNYVAGSLEAVGATSAVSLPVNTNSFVNQAVAYSWWVNNSPTAPGGAGTLYFPTGTAEAYVYNSDQKFIRLVSLRIAIVDDITVAGTVGLPLSADQTATINLYGDTVKDSGVEEIASWFNINSLPAGITATANLEADADTITVSFTGIPSAAANIAFSITIPGSRLNGGSDITVLFNPNARFDIRPSDQASDLTFTYSTTFDIPASILYAPIKDIDVSVGVSGGEKPYKYLAVGLPNGIFINGTTGVIYGIPVTAAGPGSAMIIVIDDTGASQGITINFGAVTFDTSIPDWLLPFLPPGGNWTIPFTGDALGIVLSVVTGLTLITGLFVILARKRQGQESGRHSR